MKTESFIIPENIAYPMLALGENWESFYRNQKPIIKKALQDDSRTNHIYEYPKDVSLRVETDCEDGLKQIVDDFRKTRPKSAQPKSIDWAEFIFYHNNPAKIETKLREDDILKEKMKEDHEMTAINSALAVTEAYARHLNEILLATRSTEYQNDQ